MSENTTVVAVADDSIREGGSDIATVIQSMKDNNVQVFSSLTGDDFDTKITVASAVSSALPVGDHLGTVFELENFIVQPIDMNDETTGEVVSVPRVILLAADGAAYYAISSAVLSSLQTITGIFGMPQTWKQPVPVKVVEVKTRKGFKAFNLTPVKVAKSAK